MGARTQESQGTTIEAKVLPQVAAIQESMDDLAYDRPPEAINDSHLSAGMLTDSGDSQAFWAAMSSTRK
jgi:hypothetical protein